MQVESLTKPFDNITQFLSVMQIVQATYCTKKKNHEQVTENINTLIGLNIDKKLIYNFIEKLNVYPTSFGFDFIKNQQTLNGQLVELCTRNGRPSRVLNPNIENCIFCPKSPQSGLIIKNFIFNKEPILYTDNSIGIKIYNRSRLSINL
jgi:hypothetical protein